MMNRVKDICNDIAGETLVETLVAMLIVVLAITMLAGSVVAAARVNRSAQDMSAQFSTTTVESGKTVSNLTAISDVTVTITPSAGSAAEVPVYAAKTNDSNAYMFYDINPLTNLTSVSG